MVIYDIDSKKEGHQILRSIFCYSGVQNSDYGFDKFTKMFSISYYVYLIVADLDFCLLGIINAWYSNYSEVQQL